MADSLILVLSVLTKAVFVLLLGLSVWSIRIILNRRAVLARRDDQQMSSSIRRDIETQAYSFAETPGTRNEMIRGLVSHKGSASQKEHFFRSRLIAERQQLEEGLTVLASLGSNAPFIGLFGTVLGIIQAFGTLSDGTRGMNTAMSAIAEALIATAIGLFVAIPAILAYNAFNRRIKNIMNDCESIKELYLGFEDR